MCIRRGGWTLFDLILVRFCECHVVYTTKKTASSAGATITEGHCYICSFHFGTEYCIEEIVVVLVYNVLRKKRNEASASLSCYLNFFIKKN